MAKAFIHNAKVVWIRGGKAFPVHECHDVAYPIARQYVKDHCHDSVYSGGVLKAVSMLQKEFKGI
jgi:hypothetical protein